MNRAIPMELDTFYSIDPLTGTLTPALYGTPEYPLTEDQHEPIAYMDEGDGLPYASGFFSGDHHTFADDEVFEAPSNRRAPELALSFIPFLPTVHALFKGEVFRAMYLNKENTYLYLTEVLDETNGEPTGFYSLIWVSL